MRTQGIVIVLTMAMLLAASVASGAKFQVKAALLKDLESGKELYEQDAGRLIPPASLTKIMTMYLVWEAIEQGKAKTTDRIKVSKNADLTGGSSMGVKAGESVKLIELLKGMAVASGNDACVAVAEHFGGLKSFVARMNRKAKELGLEHTVFKNPHGLPAKGQVTTARDMMVLAEAYLKRFSDSLEIHSLKTYKHNQVTKRNSNRLLGSCEGTDGLKTGYVAASGFNIIATAKRDGRRLVAVVLGGKTSSIRNAETRKILDMGFKLIGEPTMAMAAPKQVEEADADPDNAYQERVYLAHSSALQRGMYCLQESSWKSFEQAWSRALLLKSKGVATTISVADLGSKGTWNRVLIGAFADIREAQRNKESLVELLGLGHPIIRRVEEEKLIPLSDMAM